MKQKIIEIINKALHELNIEHGEVRVTYPDLREHGDFATNIALSLAPKAKMKPVELAQKIADIAMGLAPELLESASVAGPGFVNFKIKEKVFAEEAVNMPVQAATVSESEKILIEYTDPNTFKVFHIGHLMSNAIGESLAHLFEHSGKKVVRLCYPADIGLHIAKSLWAIQKHQDQMPKDDAPIHERTDFLGKMYVEGTQAYEADVAVKDDIDALNKIIYERSSEEINKLNMKGRQWSLDHFDLLYKRLGTKFDQTYYESDMAPVGLKVVQESLTKNEGVFEQSEGAVVFKGEKFGLHTRVFVNSAGLPTYESKEIGLNFTKFKDYPETTRSIIVTASEQNDYFRVLVKVLSIVYPEIGAKTEHIGHGMMRFASGKMSSRTGKVVTAEDLIEEIRDMVKAKIVGREYSPEEVESISDIVAVGAIKYTILRSAAGSDIIFDSTASISFEGDSGPYLQYSAVRSASILEKAKEAGIAGQVTAWPEKVSLLERLISRYADTLAQSEEALSAHHVAGYLVALASAFNSFYAGQVIVDQNDKLSPYFVAITRKFHEVMVDGLGVLGIRVPERM